MLPTITSECSQFLKASNGNPILRNLPSSGYGFRKVKVRQKRVVSPFTNSFNNAFVQERTNLLQRSVIVRNPVYDPAPDGTEPFYVFPIDGYKFMYCQNSEVTTELYKNTLDRLINAVGDDAGLVVFQELLKFHYEFDNLEKGIAGGSEIIVFNVPYYWALRKSIVMDYKEFCLS